MVAAALEPQPYLPVAAASFLEPLDPALFCPAVSWSKKAENEPVFSFPSLDPDFVSGVKPYLKQRPEQLGTLEKIHLGSQVRGYFDRLSKEQQQAFLDATRDRPYEVAAWLQGQGLSEDEARNAVTHVRQFKGYGPLPSAPTPPSKPPAAPAPSAPVVKPLSPPSKTPSPGVSTAATSLAGSQATPPPQTPPTAAPGPSASGPAEEDDALSMLVSSDPGKLGFLDKVRGLRAAQQWLSQIPTDAYPGLIQTLQKRPEEFNRIMENLGFDREMVKRLGSPIEVATHLGRIVQHPGGLPVQALMNRVGLGPWWMNLSPGAKWGIMAGAGPLLLGLLATLFGRGQLGLGLMLGGLGAGVLGGYGVPALTGAKSQPLPGLIEILNRVAEGPGQQDNAEAAAPPPKPVAPQAVPPK